MELFIKMIAGFAFGLLLGYAIYMLKNLLIRKYSMLKKLDTLSDYVIHAFITLILGCFLYTSFYDKPIIAISGCKILSVGALIIWILFIVTVMVDHYRIKKR